jgi:hypothetical protein
MKVIYIHLFIVMSGAILILIPSVFGDEDTAKRFITEAPKAWETLKNFQGGLEGTYHKEMKELSNVGAIIFKVDGEFKCINGNEYLYYKLTDAKGGSYQTTFCFNAKYGFILDRNSSNDPWQISTLEKHKEFILGRFERQGAILYTSITIDGQSLLWIVKQPGFKLKNARAFEKEGKELVEISFETSSYLLSDDKILGGSVVFDPNNFWAVQNYELQRLWNIKGTSKGYVEYAGQLDRFPIPKSSVIERKDEKGGGGQLTFTFKDLRKCSAPDSDFTLSKYGLPEPGKTITASSHRWVWLVLIALLCLVTASVIRFRRRNA